MAVDDPIGSNLCEKTLNVTGAGWGINTQIIFDSTYNLENGKKYAIVVSTTGLDSSNYIRWPSSNANPYNSGLYCISSDAGVTWTQFGTHDLNFANYSGTPGNFVLHEYNTNVNIFQALYGNYHVAQTWTVTQQYVISAVTLQLGYTVGNPVGTVTIGIRKVEGETYTDPPTAAINPSPANAVSTVTLDQTTISWENGGGATSYDVYFGVDAGHLNLVSSDQAGASFTISGITNGSPFDYTISRAWRIDSKNVAGTTTGTVWTFTTITFAAPAPGVRGFSGTGQGGYGGGTFADKQLNVKTRLVAFARNKVFYEDT